MTEKFIDLGPQIVKEAGGLSLTSLAHEHQLRVLKWLDEHPDQVPGRTITAERYRLVERMDGGYKRGYCDAMEELGASVDPEPTNVELLERELAVNAGYELTSDQRKIIARRLDARGVTAPEADDE